MLNNLDNKHKNYYIPYDILYIQQPNILNTKHTYEMILYLELNNDDIHKYPSQEILSIIFSPIYKPKDGMPNK